MKFRLPLPWTKAGWLRLLAVFLLAGLIAGGMYIIVLDRLGERAFHKAEEACREYRYEEALDYVKQSLRLKPSNSQAHLLAARLYRVWNDPQQAEEHLKLSKKYLKGTNEAIELEVLLLTAAGGDIKEVLPSLQPYLVIKRPESPLILEALVAGYLQKFDIYAARSLVLKWLSIEPDNPWAHLQEGRILAQLRQNEEAIKSFQNGVKVGPWIREMRINLCELLLADNAAEVALPHLEWLRDRFPEDTISLVLLTRCYRELDQLDKAEKTLEALLQLDPAFSEAEFERGMIAKERNRIEEQAEAFQRCTELDNTNALAYFNLAAAYRQLGRTEDADKTLKIYQKLNKDLQRMGIILQKLNVNSPGGGDPELYFELGEIRKRMGKSDEAARTFGRVLALDPNHQGAHRQLADYYGEKGYYERAAFHVSKLNK